MLNWLPVDILYGNVQQAIGKVGWYLERDFETKDKIWIQNYLKIDTFWGDETMWMNVNAKVEILVCEK